MISNSTSFDETNQGRYIVKGKILLYSVFALVIPLVALFTGQPAAMEGEPKAEEPLASCGGWLNCHSESPNFTGLCCRICNNRKQETVWDCKPLLPEDESRGASAAADVALGERTLTGVVTAEGLLKVDNGHNYKIAGTKLKMDEVQKKLGKKIEIKGAVKEGNGKATIEIESYNLVYSEIAAPGEDDLSSCTAWLNCDRRPPNYTGTCCRQCQDRQGAKAWDCQVFSGLEHFDRTEWPK
jgi:hypothetical protein